MYAVTSCSNFNVYIILFEVIKGKCFHTKSSSNIWFRIITFLFLVSPCDNNPCENNGTCSVDVNFEATCACNGEWSGYYCSGKFI